MKPGDADDGPARDPWLSQALRHAPDADVVPPAALSAAILREARAAAAPKQRLRAWWAWLATPPVAAGFASLMVATVVGLMWWDRPLDEAVAERDQPAAAAPVLAEAPAVAPAPTPPVAAGPETRRADEATRQRRAEVVAPRREAAEPSAKTAARGLAAPAADAATPPQDAATKAAANAELRATNDAVAAAPGAATALPHPRPSLARQTDTARGSAAQPVQQLRAAIAADPGRWAWQRGDAAPRPADAAMLRWLDQLVQAMGAGAPSVPPGAPDAGAGAGADNAATSMTSLQFLVDGGVRARLRLGAGRVEFSTAGIAGTTSQASLTPATAAALQSALAAAFD